MPNCQKKGKHNFFKYSHRLNLGIIFLKNKLAKDNLAGKIEQPSCSRRQVLGTHILGDRLPNLDGALSLRQPNQRIWLSLAEGRPKGQRAIGSATLSLGLARSSRPQPKGGSEWLGTSKLGRPKPLVMFFNFLILNLNYFVNLVF